MRWAIGISGIIVLLGALVLLLIPDRREGLAVLGDEAPKIQAALNLPSVDASNASVVVLSLDTWWKLQFVTDLDRLCGQTCREEPEAVRVLRWSPLGTQAILYLPFDAWGGPDRPECVPIAVAAAFNRTVEGPADCQVPEFVTTVRVRLRSL